MTFCDDLLISVVVFRIGGVMWDALEKIVANDKAKKLGCLEAVLESLR